MKTTPPQSSNGEHLQGDVVKIPSLSEVKACIPPHCFEKSTWISLGYVAYDLIQVALLALGITYIDSFVKDITALRAVSWLIYWICQVHAR